MALGRFATLRSWLSQWSIEDSNADGVANAAHITVPFLAIENSADDAVPTYHTPAIHQAAASTDKTYRVVKGGTHYYAGQPDHLKEAVTTQLDWLRARGLFDG